MQHLVYSLFLLLCSCQAFAQERVIDFGELKRTTQRYADVKIHNYSEQSVYIVKIEHSPEIVYRVDREYIRPDSAFTLRIQVNPDTTGAFSHVVRVYMSDSELPIEMRIKGNVKAMPDYNGVAQKCPEFPKKKEPDHTEFTVTSIDAETQEVIGKSTVTIIRDGAVSESWVMSSVGSLRRNVKPGFLYFVVSHDGYATTETGVYITPEIETVYIPLKKNRDNVSPPAGDKPREELAEKIPDEQLEKVLSRQIAADSAEYGIPQLADIPMANFDPAVFKPVNVVFVLDVSSSMKLGEKMSLLKYSLNQLTETLRPQDRICFVTYSKGASVYLKPTSCANKELIRSKITALEAEGLSSSTKGIKLGYKELTREMQPGDANMIVVITDGAFNKYSDDYQKIVRRYAAQGITFSVVGIHSRSADEKKMKEAAAFGKGSYIPINRLADAQYRLLQEIRMNAYRGE